MLSIAPGVLDDSAVFLKLAWYVAMASKERSVDCFVCDVCSRSYGSRLGRDKHRIKCSTGEKSGRDVAPQTASCFEAGCQYKGSRIGSLREHLEKIHGFVFAYEKREFQSSEGKKLIL
jgi:hypothetical protein